MRDRKSQRVWHRTPTYWRYTHREADEVARCQLCLGAFIDRAVDGLAVLHDGGLLQRVNTGTGCPQ